MAAPRIFPAGLGTFCFAWVARAAAIPDASKALCDTERGQGIGCPNTSLVPTRNGPVIGVLRQSDETAQVPVGTFWGIPFAEPPVGQNRFRAPGKLARKWEEPLLAKQHSNVCYHAVVLGKLYHEQQEDCLYLNVYTPAAAVGTEAGLPVMVWIPGGAFVGANAYDSLGGPYNQDGAALAGTHDVVVVTLNYRLGGLGFFASDALRVEDPAGSTGNMAILDQRVGLEWVQENIGGFGGSRERVTIFGESAGSFSTIYHLVSPRSWPLFHQAILMSGTSKTSVFFQPYEGHAREFYAQWAEKIGCPRGGHEQLECLRAVDAKKVLHPPGGITVASPLYDASLKTRSFFCGPVIDGSAVGLVGEPLKLMQQGHFHRVPLLLGNNRDEGTTFNIWVSRMAPGLEGTSLRDRFLYRVSRFFNPRDIKSIESVYHHENEFRTFSGQVDYGLAFSRMIRDFVFSCSDKAVAEALAQYSVPAWLYVVSADLGLVNKVLGLGNLHGSAIPFIFRWNKQMIPNFDQISDIISCKLTTFAKAGRPDAAPEDLPPNCRGVQKKYAFWPQYNRSLGQYYSLQLPPRIGHIRSTNRFPDDEFPNDMKCNVLRDLNTRWLRPDETATELPVLV